MNNNNFHSCLLFISIISICVNLACSDNSDNPFMSVYGSDFRELYKNKILFLSNRWSGDPAEFHIGLINCDGTEMREVYGKRDVTKIEWSLKEGKIFFVSDTSAANSLFQIYMCDLNGKYEQLLFTSQYGVYDIQCSPDGDLLLLLLINGDQTKLKILDYVNREVIKETEWSEEIRTACWSPNGTKIAYLAYEGIDLIIKTKRMDGDLIVSSSGYRLYHDMLKDYNYIDWSPYNDEIAVNINHFGFALSYSFHYSMREEYSITAGNYYSEGMSWSQMADRIVFAEKLVWVIDEQRQLLPSSLFVYNNNGTDKVQITDNLYDDIEPCWH